VEKSVHCVMPPMRSDERAGCGEGEAQGMGHHPQATKMPEDVKYTSLIAAMAPGKCGCNTEGGWRTDGLELPAEGFSRLHASMIPVP
jgi:hypothetical protein